MAKLVIVSVILVLSAAMSLTEAQEAPSCGSKLIPCATYINTNTTPSASCCNAIKEAVTNELDCLCNLYNDPNFLKSFNTSVPAALQLTRNCGESTDLGPCSKAQSPTASVPPPPGQAGSDGGAADRIAWTGITPLLLFLGPALLY